MAPFQPLQPWAPAGCLGVALAASASFSHFRPTWDPVTFNLDWSWVLGRFRWKLCRIRAGEINQRIPEQPSKHFFPYNATNSALNYKSCWWLCQDCASSVSRHVPSVLLARFMTSGIFGEERESGIWDSILQAVKTTNTSASCENYTYDKSEATITWYTVLDSVQWRLHQSDDFMISWFTRFLPLCR